MKKHIADLNVIQADRLNHNHVLLSLAVAPPFPPMVPGQFVEVLIENAPSTYLRRPFSIHDADPDAGTIYLLIKEIGDGTRWLGSRKPGDKVNTIFPLGKGFSMPPKGPVLLIGGGCGVAPLLFLARYLSQHQIDISILIGGASAKDILRPEAYQIHGQVFVTTEDGSMGHKGNVTDHPVFREELSRYTQVYTCGPEGMMRAVAAGTSVFQIPCEVSLENTMACGIGACLCCVTQTTSGNRCVCIDGPVFNTHELLWLISA